MIVKCCFHVKELETIYLRTRTKPKKPEVNPSVLQRRSEVSDRPVGFQDGRECVAENILLRHSRLF